MKKKRYRLLPAVLLAVLFTLPVHAAGDERWIEYDGGELVNNFPAGDLADTVNQMQPGDTATFAVTLKNTDDAETDWYMLNDVTKNMEKDSQATGGAYTYQLTYEADGQVQELYNSDRVNGTNAADPAAQSEEGLSEAVGSLKNYFYLDTLGSGETAQVVLTIGLDGETQGNIYQDRDARLLMNFAVEERPKPAPGESDRTVIREVAQTTVQALQSVTSPRTGDTNRLMFWSVMLVLSASLAAGLLLYGMKSRRKGGAGHE